MTATLKPEAAASITIGPRTRREIELRIRELQCRHNHAPRDRLEISRLEEFLRTVAPRDGKVGTWDSR
jgi:hypothetical protein